MKSRLIACVGLLAAAGLLHAADLKAGQEKATQLCAACHNADGKSTNPQYPVLAGQHADYLRQALKAYQSGDRNNAIMAGMAKPLSKADIDNLAAWFASQSSKLNQTR
ncbi:cytochrome c [Burkholderiaceae bacterium DAT-1]|nr:cytochrome c [Burkholderiaceae bacterium DAT-1]